MRTLSIIVCVLTIVNGEIRVSLNSDKIKWSVCNTNNSINIRATVPGGIYTDLQNAGVISKNLFYRFNDIELRWIGYESWIYRTMFTLPAEVMNKRKINLVLHGVDTIATVHLNRKKLTATQNMFVRYVIPLKEFLKKKDNVLEIRFKSPVLESKNLSDSHGYKIPPSCNPAHYQGECHVNFLRKMQASFAWDWGPAFPSVGLWKSVEVEAYDSAVLRDVVTELTDFQPTTWLLNVTAYVEVANEDISDYELHGIFVTENSSISDKSSKGFIENGLLVVPLQFRIPKDNVQLWWPNGFGEQHLYKMHIAFFSENATEISSNVLRIGIRTVELVQEKIRPTKEGLTFYFRVNGVPIFAKGSNWIPSHILPELSYDEKRIRSLLLSAKDAHMNILRVWGGGLYESDLFYETADELGIMIWQDMMYACSMYPTNLEFLQNVMTETVQQVMRLQHHPSIVLWAGNNENEAALRGNWYGTSHNFELYKRDYKKLYVETIQPIVLSVDKTRSYVVSSPSNGIMSEEEDYVANDPYSPLYGDTHFYNYILDSWDSETYPFTRFASEYGLQSLPCFKTMAEVTLPGDRRIESQFSSKRQHLLAGYFLMAIQMKFRLPELIRHDEEEYYKSFIYYSQIAQAMGIKTETEKYRRDRNKLTDRNEGRTMGAMYWQLNDVWQAPTWSSIDFNGRWKMLHYYSKKFFSPVLISLDLILKERLYVYVVSDLLKDIPKAQMNLSVYSWDCFEPKKMITTTQLIRKSRSTLVARYNLTELLNDANCNITECFIHASLRADDVDVDNILFPTSFSKVTNLQPATIVTDVKKSRNSSQILVHIQTDRIAPFVWLETDEEGEFSDNGFTLIQPTNTIEFRNRFNAVDFKKFKASLTVRSLLR